MVSEAPVPGSQTGQDEETREGLSGVDFGKATLQDLVIFQQKLDAEVKRRIEQVRQRVKEAHKWGMPVPHDMEVDKFPPLLRGLLASIPTIKSPDTVVSLRNYKRPHADGFVLSWGERRGTELAFTQLELVPFPGDQDKERILEAAPSFRGVQREDIVGSPVVIRAAKFCREKINSKPPLWQLGVVSELLDLTTVTPTRSVFDTYRGNQR